MKCFGGLGKKDTLKLMQCIEFIKQGKTSDCKSVIFDNNQLNEEFHEMADALIEYNNKAVMDLNTSMSMIGNCNHFQNMLEIVDRQQEMLQSVAGSGNILTDSISRSTDVLADVGNEIQKVAEESKATKMHMKDTDSHVNTIYEDVQQADDAVREFSNNSQKIQSILKEVNEIAVKTRILSLNAKVEAQRAGVHGKGFSVVADEVGELSDKTQQSVGQIENFVNATMSDLEKLTQTMNSVKEHLNECLNGSQRTNASVQHLADSIEQVDAGINELLEQMKLQNQETQQFIHNVSIITDDSDNLKACCMEPGKDMYLISRSVDKIRTYMTKKQTDLEVKEWIDIYIADHLIFTGRLYNMIEGFETLKLSNLENPDKCKFGKWARNLKNSGDGHVASINNAVELHAKLHVLATECYHANEMKKREKALQYYKSAQQVYQLFAQEMEKIKQNW